MLALGTIIQEEDLQCVKKRNAMQSEKLTKVQTAENFWYIQVEKDIKMVAFEDHENKFNCSNVVCLACLMQSYIVIDLQKDELTHQKS